MIMPIPQTSTVPRTPWMAGLRPAFLKSERLIPSPRPAIAIANKQELIGIKAFVKDCGKIFKVLTTLIAKNPKINQGIGKFLSDFFFV